MNSPASFGLPWDSWRPGQRLAIRTAVSAKQKHVVILSPTGSGKSAIALGIAKFDTRRTAILTAGKGLQQQYIHDAGASLTDIRGMGNYECLAARDEFQRLFPFKGNRTVACDDGPCHSDIPCTLKDDGCLYFDAYRRAMASRTLLTNYDYWVASRRFSKGLGVVDRLICDEAHDCFDKLMSACKIELHLSEVEGKIPRTLATWKQFAAARINQLRGQTHGEDKQIRKRRMIERLEAILQADKYWAFEQRGDSVVFEPTVPRYLSRLLFDANMKVIYLSATITPETVSSVLNIPRDDIAFLGLPSRFPVQRRPIFLVKTCRVDFRWTAEDQSFWLERIDAIIDKCEGRKGLIHTVSYDRQQMILARSRHRSNMLAPRRASELASAVSRFKASDRPLILVSPSVDTGFDFPGKECEFQIVTKVPFPDTRSPIMKARIRATPRYRDIMTAQKLVQMVGRGMRSEEDTCTTYVIDDHARWFVNNNREFFPDYFLDAIVPTGRLPPPRPRL